MVFYQLAYCLDTVPRLAAREIILRVFVRVDWIIYWYLGYHIHLVINLCLLGKVKVLSNKIMHENVHLLLHMHCWRE